MGKKKKRQHDSDFSEWEHINTYGEETVDEDMESDAGSIRPRSSSGGTLPTIGALEDFYAEEPQAQRKRTSGDLEEAELAESTIRRRVAVAHEAAQTAKHRDQLKTRQEAESAALQGAHKGHERQRHAKQGRENAGTVAPRGGKKGFLQQLASPFNQLRILFVLLCIYLLRHVATSGELKKFWGESDVQLYSPKQIGNLEDAGEKHSRLRGSLEKDTASKISKEDKALLHQQKATKNREEKPDEKTEAQRRADKRKRFYQ